MMRQDVAVTISRGHFPAGLVNHAGRRHALPQPSSRDHSSAGAAVSPASHFPAQGAGSGIPR